MIFFKFWTNKLNNTEEEDFKQNVNSNYNFLKKSRGKQVNIPTKAKSMQNLVILEVKSAIF